MSSKPDISSAATAGLVSLFEMLELDCAPPAGEISSRFEGSVIGAFSLLNCHLEFLRG